MKKICVLICLFTGFVVSVCPQSTDKGDWGISYYNDEFGDKTKEAYIAKKHYIQGTFSNSRTRDGYLKVAVLYDADGGLMFEFYQYEWVNRPYTPLLFNKARETFDVLIQDGKGRRHSVSAYIDDQTYKFYFDPSNVGGVLGCLLGGGTVKFLFKELKNVINTFRFDIDTAGFSAAYKELTGKSN